LVEGRVSVDENETRWRFQPEEPWVAGNHQLHIDAALEDLAGNSIARPFEVYLPDSRPADIGKTVIPFQIGPATKESPTRAKLP
jgi:hypothetical protein